MNTTTFLMLLGGFSVLTSLVTEGIKKLFKCECCNIVATLVGLVIGTAGSFLYYQFNGIALDTNNVIYAVLMGGASALTAMVGFDKVKEALVQCGLLSTKNEQ